MNIIDEIVKEISENRNEILDSFCKVILANSGTDKNAIRNNLDRMVLHNQLVGFLNLEQKWWVTFDAKMSYGDWQPIETAPKDETYLLLYVPAGRQFGKGYVFSGFWCTADQEFVSLPYCHIILECTHWMPLPEAPDA